MMNLDHVAINAVNLDTELDFLTDFMGLELLQIWPTERQAYVGLKEGALIGVMENKSFDGSQFTMAHLAFSVSKKDFDNWVEKIQSHKIELVAGPKAQRGGETILFRTPSKNIIEICYPHVRETIANQMY